MACEDIIRSAGSDAAGKLVDAGGFHPIIRPPSVRFLLLALVSKDAQFLPCLPRLTARTLCHSSRCGNCVEVN